MSTTLLYHPVTPNKDKSLDDRLKHAIAERFFGHDGSLNSDEVILTEKSIEYLQGLVDAGIKDAQKLINAIEKYGEVAIYTRN